MLNKIEKKPFGSILFKEASSFLLHKGSPAVNKSDQKSDEDVMKDRNQPIENDIAEYISYDYVDRSIYIAGLRIFEEFSTEEFGYSNEGSCAIIEDENALIFSITTATGSIYGALDGPTIYFKMDLDTNKIIEKEFGSAPNYDELGLMEFAEYRKGRSYDKVKF
mgnify:CR=1 FL=1